MYEDTYGMCPTCYKTVEAKLKITGAGVFLTKFCEEHGEHTVLVDPNTETYCGDLGRYWGRVIESTALAVTDKCNMRCSMCYHDVSDAQDKSISYFLALANKAESSRIILMGAEPTMREDLPQLISEIRGLGKTAYLYTNGLNLADDWCLHKLVDAGLNGLCFSLHTANKNTNSSLHKKYQALENLLDLKDDGYDFDVSHVSFSIDNLYEVDEAISRSLALRDLAHHFRIRLPGCAGRYRQSDLYLTDLVNAAKAVAEHRGLSWEPKSRGNGAYYKIVKIAGVIFRFISVPPADALDFNQLPPMQKALYVPGLDEAHFIHHVAIEDGIRTGKIAVTPDMDWSDYNFRSTKWLV